jgi:hypothetical protein
VRPIDSSSRTVARARLRLRSRAGSHPRLRRAVAASSAAVLGSGAVVIAATTTASAASGCQATYSITSQWNVGFGASVSVTNLGAAITSWTVGWTFPGNQQITQLWNGTYSQSGAAVTVTNASYNGSVGTNAALSFGFNGSYSGTNGVPAQFTLNGTVCTGTVSSSTPTQTPTPTPTPSATRTSSSPSASATASASASPSPSSSGGSPGAGTWVAAPVNPYSGGPATFMWLLSDGSILSNGADLHQWVKLVPDQFGSYANGSWVSLATSPYGLGAAQEHILPDGRFYQAGGEYVYFWPSGSSSNDHNGVQLYNPVTNTWSLGQSGLYGHLEDTGSASLRNGSIVSSDQQSANTQIFNPSTNTWSAAGSRPSSSGEDGWVPLSDGSVVSVGNYGSWRFDPTANKWYSLPAAPSGYQNGNVDSSMVTLMYDGRIFVTGSNATAIYTPGASVSSPGSWVQGPPTPQGTYTDDVYTTPEPNGKVIFDSVRCSWITNQCGSSSGPLVNEFDPTTNTISSISLPPDSAGAPVNFLDLPNGQVMAAAGSRNWIWTPVGGPQNAWRPTVTSVTANSNGSYHLTGTQLSGLVSVGEDDYQGPENYPIVYLKDGAGHVYYARSYNFSSMVPSKPGEVQTADFSLPSSLAHGTYSLYVSACGVSSATGYSFTY